ncbi:hypothetical protein [Chitinophaga cymbidii]|nr:hypothetical protein [Chitinophaga cymbidii]
MTTKFFVFAAGMTLLFAACKKEKNETPTENANEEITTLKLTFTNAANAADKVVANWKDMDGAGGTNPVIDPVSLKANTTYNVTTELFDERKNPADTVTNEIEEEGAEHRVFHLFFTNPGASVADSLTNVATVTPQDKDENNLPVGLDITMATKTAFTGFLRVVVRHQPGNKDGTYAPGSTDVLTEFPLEIK